VAERAERERRALPLKSMAEKIKVQVGGGNSFTGIGRSNRGGTILRTAGGRIRGNDIADGGRAKPKGRLAKAALAARQTDGRDVSTALPVTLTDGASRIAEAIRQRRLTQVETAGRHLLRSVVAGELAAPTVGYRPAQGLTVVAGLLNEFLGRAADAFPDPARP
jgi:hypothetical protein